MADTKEKEPVLSNIKSYLEVGTNVAVLLVAIAVLATLAHSFYLSRTMTRARTQSETVLRKGAILDEIVGVDFQVAPKTLLLLLNTDCRYCTESLTFYKNLATSVGVADKNFKTLCPREFQLAQRTATPTLILTNRQRQITNFWIGKLSPESEWEVLKAVEGLQ